jgi:uncharacterized protein RhaS with RHS repeats
MRFISEDPIGLAGGLNSYTYVRGNPVSLVDPFGLVDFNLFPADEDIRRYADLTPSPPGVYTIGPDGRISPRDLANRLREDPRFGRSTSIQLISCNVGNGRYAQQLANRLRKPVSAPNNYAWLNPRGTTPIVAPGIGGSLDAGPDMGAQGRWITAAANDETR